MAKQVPARTPCVRAFLGTSVGVSEAAKNDAPKTIPTLHSDSNCRLMMWAKLFMMRALCRHQDSSGTGTGECEVAPTGWPSTAILSDAKHLSGSLRFL